jgi:hypothetical protein
MSHLCFQCGEARDREGQRYCRACHAAYQRDWRRQRTRLLQQLMEQHSDIVQRETIEARR